MLEILFYVVLVAVVAFIGYKYFGDLDIPNVGEELVVTKVEPKPKPKPKPKTKKKPTMTIEELNSMTKEQLFDMATQLDLEVYKSWTKTKLMSTLATHHEL